MNDIKKTCDLERKRGRRAGTIAAILATASGSVMFTSFIASLVDWTRFSIVCGITVGVMIVISILLIVREKQRCGNVKGWHGNYPVIQSVPRWKKMILSRDTGGTFRGWIAAMIIVPLVAAFMVANHDIFGTWNPFHDLYLSMTTDQIVRLVIITVSGGGLFVLVSLMIAFIGK
jgi:hypothetical protein